MSGRKLLLLLLAVGLVIHFLPGGKRPSEADFVGKWQSSRTNTPIHLAANGEWEIRTEEGRVLQYGLWRYADKQLVWTYKQGSQFLDDANPVLSVEAGSFSLRETNGTSTVFQRLP